MTFPAAATGNFVLAANGDIYVGPKWDDLKHEITLGQKHGDTWQLEVVAKGDFTASRFHLLLDNEGQPCVVFGRVYEPYGWVKQLTPTESRF